MRHADGQAQREPCNTGTHNRSRNDFLPRPRSDLSSSIDVPGETTTKNASALRAWFDRFSSTARQALRTSAVAVSLDSCNRILRGGARFCCDESPQARGLASHRRDIGNVEWLWSPQAGIAVRSSHSPPATKHKLRQRIQSGSKCYC